MNFNPTYHTYSAGKKLTWEPVVWKSREQSMFMEMVFPGTIQKAELEKRRAGFLGMPLEEYKAQAGNPDGL